MNTLRSVFLNSSRFYRYKKSQTTKFLWTQNTEINMDLKTVVAKLNQFASPSLAESWDNVGLLTEPSSPHMVKTILLTNDLTPLVLEEAVQKNVNMILAYHPPIFSPMKKLTQRSWKEKLIVKCIENSIAVYSPHTCYDALSGGVNDWLIGAFDTKSMKPVEQSETDGEYNFAVDLTVARDSAAALVSALRDKSSSQRISTSLWTLHDKTDSELTKIQVLCQRCDVTRLVSVAQAHTDVVTVEKREIGKVPLVGYGMGRVGKLTTKISLDEAVNRVKSYLNLQHVRLAATPESASTKISSVAVCAGSGSSVLRTAKADLFVTGEMSHHDVINAVSNGTSVILCEHSNTERGYLTKLSSTLKELFSDQVEITLSETDADPLKVV